MLEALRDVDVRGLLPQLAVPTLVLHRTNNKAVHIEAGRRLAAAIKNARFVESRTLEEIRAFVRQL